MSKEQFSKGLIHPVIASLTFKCIISPWNNCFISTPRNEKRNYYWLKGINKHWKLPLIALYRTGNLDNLNLSEQLIQLKFERKSKRWRSFLNRVNFLSLFQLFTLFDTFLNYITIHYLQSCQINAKDEQEVVFNRSSSTVTVHQAQ